MGAEWWHVSTEGLMAIIAVGGIFLLLRNSWRLKIRLDKASYELAAEKKDSAIWRERARLHIEGLSKAIDAQLNDWQLTPAEKEIALLLLKGLSLREIAGIRHTNEKTVRSQATIIYQKSGLSGRADLSAFFLEDLLG
jgi:DNA-binding CsgD family transcriptional regulator